MFTAMLSVENILGAQHDVWAVNVEAEYHEQSNGEHDERPPVATLRCCRAARSTPRPRLVPRSRRRMPPAG